MPFIPHTPGDIEQMLGEIGAKSIDDLFDEIPKELRIEALANSGQSQAAAELAARFAKQNPSSPLVDRARSFIRESGQGGSAHEGK